MIWLSEAFTKPAMMHTPRQGRLPAELHLLRVAQREVGARGVRPRARGRGTGSAYMRPSFWPTTHDILTPYMQYGGPTAWKLRAALAATMVADLRHLRRLRADGARRPARRRGADRQREVRVQGPSVVPLRAGRPAREPLARLVPQAAQRHPRLAPRAAAGCATCASTRADDENVMVFSKSPRRRPGRRASATPSSSSPTSTRTPPGRRGVHLDMEALGMATWSTLRRARPHHRTRRGSGDRTTSCGSGPTPSPSTSST